MSHNNNNDMKNDSGLLNGNKNNNGGGSSNTSNGGLMSGFDSHRNNSNRDRDHDRESNSRSNGHKQHYSLTASEVAAVKQLVSGYRESAAFLLRSADELENLLLSQT